MPYVTSIERIDREIGLRRGIQSLLKVRFGDEGLKLMPEIQQVYGAEKLEAILDVLETAASTDEVRRLWTTGTPQA